MYIPDTGIVSTFFWIFFIFVPGTHFYRKQTKYTTPAANPVHTPTRKHRVSEGVVLCCPVFPLANEKPARTMKQMWDYGICVLPRPSTSGAASSACSAHTHGKKQTIYIGPVKVVTDPFFQEGVIHIKLTSHVSIAVSTRMILAWHQQWSGRNRPCLVYRRDGYRFAL